MVVAAVGLSSVLWLLPLLGSMYKTRGVVQNYLLTTRRASTSKNVGSTTILTNTRRNRLTVEKLGSSIITVKNLVFVVARSDATH